MWPENKILIFFIARKIARLSRTFALFLGWNFFNLQKRLELKKGIFNRWKKTLSLPDLLTNSRIMIHKNCPTNCLEQKFFDRKPTSELKNIQLEKLNDYDFGKTINKQQKSRKER